MMDWDDEVEARISDRSRKRYAFGPVHPLGDPSLVRAFLGQGDSWCSAGQEYVAVADMTPAHALASASYVLDRSTSVLLVLLAAGDHAVSYHEVADERAARGYLLDTPLVKALITRGQSARENPLPWVAARAARSVR